MNGATGDPYARFSDIPDEDIVELANTENNVLAQEYLMHKYRNFVRGKAKSYFLIGAEREDIIQEGMIGLYKAIRDFRREEFIEIKNKMNMILSDLEWEVFMNYLDGKSYQETARELNRHIKSIDNALQRVKRKVEKYKETHSGDADINAACSCILSIEPRKRDKRKDV